MIVGFSSPFSLGYLPSFPTSLRWERVALHFALNYSGSSCLWALLFCRDNQDRLWKVCYKHKVFASLDLQGLFMLLESHILSETHPAESRNLILQGWWNFKKLHRLANTSNSPTCTLSVFSLCRGMFIMHNTQDCLTAGEKVVDHYQRGRLERTTGLMQSAMCLFGLGWNIDTARYCIASSSDGIVDTLPFYIVDVFIKTYFITPCGVNLVSHSFILPLNI